MGCRVSKSVYPHHKKGVRKQCLQLYSRDGRKLYTLIYTLNDEYLLVSCNTHNVVKLERMSGISTNNKYIVIDGLADPGWWLSATWKLMFDEINTNINNDFLINTHYLRLELSKLSLTKKHKKLGIKYLISIGTYDNSGVFTIFNEVMYGL